MWFVRWFLTLLVLLYGVLFAALNLGQRVTLRIPWIDGSHRFEQVELVLVLIAAVALGMAVWAVVAFVGSLELRSRIRQLERRGRALKEELGRLRNLSVLEDQELAPEKPKPAPGVSRPRPAAPPDDDDDLTAGDLPTVRSSGL